MVKPMSSSSTANSDLLRTVRQSVWMNKAMCGKVVVPVRDRQQEVRAKAVGPVNLPDTSQCRAQVPIPVHKVRVWRVHKAALEVCHSPKTICRVMMVRSSSLSAVSASLIPWRDASSSREPEPKDSICAIMFTAFSQSHSGPQRVRRCCNP